VLSTADPLIIFLTPEIFLTLWRAASLEKRGGLDGWGFRQKIPFSMAQKAAI